jgi:two-component system chemotaxis sensor kinase CheA
MDNEQYLELFLSEAEEILTSLSQNLVDLEKNPTDSNVLAEIFRGCHTLKGNAAAMGMVQVEKLTHAMEHILGRLRSSEIMFNHNVARCLFQSLNLLNELIKAIQHKSDGLLDETPLVNELKNLAEQHSPTTPEPAAVIPAEATEINSSNSIKLRKLKSVRINLDRLESLINVVGELHISKIQLSELSRKHDDPQLTQAVNEMERAVNQLQTEIMQMRLLPLKYIFNNFPRLVRADADKDGKEVILNISGEEIGLDRTILDEINDPLLHIIRNAVSHGIETPEERRKIGKPPQGTIQIKASQEQNRVLITIYDDGYGLDAKKIRQTIYSKGLMPEGSLERLSEEEIFLLITLPGFSLSEQINERSGRGVGMNVVKSQIEGIGGSLAIHSELGKGTTFILRFPISIAIIHALLVHVDEEIYAIPLYNIVETIKIDSSLVRQVNRQEIVPYRDEVLPLIRLHNQLNVFSDVSHKEKICIVVCDVNHQKIGFIVEEFVGEQEIVVKNLTCSMDNIRGCSGATILSNGRVAMILDLASLK